MSKMLTREARRRYLAMSERLVKPGSGTHPSVARERTFQYGAPALARHLGDVAYVVVGGLATRLYMQERMTLDADVLVAPSSAAEAETALAKTSCAKIGALAIGGSAWRLPDGSTLDLIVLREPWAEEAVACPVAGEDGLRYIALPFLVLMKLASGRIQDLADITRMLGGASDDSLREVRRTVRQWREQDGDDLESMIRLGKLEHGSRA